MTYLPDAPVLFIIADVADAAAAQQLAERTRAAGIIAHARPLEQGGQVDETSLNLLSGATAAVLIFSARAASSRLVDRALLVARQLRKPVIPVRLEQVDEGLLRQELLDARWVEWRDPAATAAIVGQAYALQRHQSSAPDLRPASPQPRPPTLLYALAGGALIAVIAAAIVWIATQRPPPPDTARRGEEAAVIKPSDSPAAAATAPAPAPAAAPAARTLADAQSPAPRTVQQPRTQPPAPLFEPARPAPTARGTYTTSYNCARAATATEVAVCEDPVLASLDVRMAGMYRQRRREYPGRSGQFLVDGQREWLAQRRQCGANYNCLSQIYQARIDELSSMGD